MDYNEYLTRLANGEIVSPDDITPSDEQLAKIKEIARKRLEEKEAEKVQSAEPPTELHDSNANFHSRMDGSGYSDSLTLEERLKKIDEVKKAILDLDTEKSNRNRNMRG